MTKEEKLAWRYSRLEQAAQWQNNNSNSIRVEEKIRDNLICKTKTMLIINLCLVSISSTQQWLKDPLLVITMISRTIECHPLLLRSLLDLKVLLSRTNSLSTRLQSNNNSTSSLTISKASLHSSSNSLCLSPLLRHLNRSPSKWWYFNKVSTRCMIPLSNLPSKWLKFSTKCTEITWKWSGIKKSFCTKCT